MKKAITAGLLSAAVGIAQAASFGITQEFVTHAKTKAESTAQVVNVSGAALGYGLGLTARTTRAEHNGALGNSLELTGSKATGPVTAFAGVGHDNGARMYQYGVVGLGASLPIWGPVSLTPAISRRVNWDDRAPEQTLARIGVSYAVNKQISVNTGFSRSYRDINEKAYTLGLRVNF